MSAHHQRRARPKPRCGGFGEPIGGSWVYDRAPGLAMTRPVEAGTRVALEELLARYVHCIDNDALEAWPDFFVEGGQYLVTTRQNHSSSWPIGIMYCDGRGMMQDRVTALRKAFVYFCVPEQHIVSCVLHVRAVDCRLAVERGIVVLYIGPQV